jgi:hypothetical protein
MARAKQSTGKCVFCGSEGARSGMTRHLGACKAWQAAIANADAAPGEPMQLYHLRAQTAWSGPYFLDLEVRGSSRLEALDRYLRAIWLECCGHLSDFCSADWRVKVPKSRNISDVFAPDVELTHHYDFGTTSVTVVKCVGARRGQPLSPHPIFLMARNMPPEIDCDECAKPATHLCQECEGEYGNPGWLCEKHARKHSHGFDEMLPIVNSPRMGMCGYDGPAVPPY